VAGLHVETEIMRDMTMPYLSDAHAAPTSRKGLLAGRILSTFVVLFLLFDALGKLLMVAPVVEGSTQLGYPESTVFGIGAVLLACTILYVTPRTSVLGAILLTGYLGGAIATHVRVGNPLFTHTLFPIYVAAMAWGGLYLREDRLRALVPVRD
jgi:DoxX-like family